MEKIYRISELKGKIHNPVVTLGVFDGVHRGHQKIIEYTKSLASEKSGDSVIITFDVHPRVLLENKTPFFITSLSHRLVLFERLSVDYTLILSFNDSLAQTNAEDFIENILVKELGSKCIVLGFNCHFGKNRSGNIKLVKELAGKYHYEAHECPPETYKGQVISSTIIRKAIQEGALEKAEAMLGRPVSILGTVVRKSGRGVTMGYPTANLDLHHEIRPPQGVYATKVCWKEKEYLALTNIGSRPTFSKETLSSEDETMEIETHILDFHESIYGKDLEVQFLFRIRDEIPFGSIEALKQQIEKDKEILLKKVLSGALMK
ncbi:bifunctional riboflavin kinase/FAD synthetase [Candidatus Kuenenia sp.]|uniref:bifunctional riboflavin kinase/FAD synthetase n=1 Tax=Candidatus Kuenenia sp. TaxID=2499824 RepID=UPI00321FEE4C